MKTKVCFRYWLCVFALGLVWSPAIGVSADAPERTPHGSQNGSTKQSKTTGPAPATNAAALPADDETCSPACPSGYACKDGLCVSPCNPSCDADELCTRNGHCLPHYQTTQTLQTPVTAAPGKYSLTPLQQQERSDTALMNNDLIAKYDHKIRGGRVLVALGATLIGIAAILGGVSGATSMGEFLLVGIGVEVLGNIFLISGIVIAVKARRLRAKALVSSTDDIVPNHVRRDLILNESRTKMTATAPSLRITFSF